MEGWKENVKDGVVRVQGKFYPTTLVKVHSVRDKESPNFTPEEATQYQVWFRSQEKLPTLRVEHSALPEDELGVVQDVWMNWNDGWMWMTADVYKHQAARVRTILHSVEEGRAGVSLGYCTKSPEYKRILEISMVSDPDFPAELHRTHGSEHETRLLWNVSERGPFPPHHHLLTRQMTDETSSPASAPDDAALERHMTLVGDRIVVTDSQHEAAARDWADRHGHNPLNVVVEDMSLMDDMPAEERHKLMAAAITENTLQRQALQKQQDEQHEAQRLARIQKLTGLASSFAKVIAPGSESAATQSLADQMARDPKLEAFANLSLATVMTKERELVQLRQQVSELTSRSVLPGESRSSSSALSSSLSAALPPKPLALMSHSASSSSSSSSSSLLKVGQSQSFADMWLSMKRQHEENQRASAPSTAVVTHGASRPGKRAERPVLDPSPLMVPIGEYEIRTPLQTFKLMLPGEDKRQRSSEGVNIVCHSAKGTPADERTKSSEYLQHITPESSDEEVAGLLTCAVLSGARTPYIDPRGVTHNVLPKRYYESVARNPALFTALVVGSGVSDTNASAGLHYVSGRDYDHERAGTIDPVRRSDHVLSVQAFTELPSPLPALPARHVTPAY